VPAELTLLGLSPGRPRSELAAELAAPTGRRLAAARRQLAVAAATLRTGLAAGELDAARWRQQSVSLLESERDRLAAGGAPPAPGECARLLLGLDDVRVRDEAMGWASADPTDRPTAERGGEPLWRALLRAAPDECAAAPAALLAWSAYLRGDGLVANLALERALQADPGYRLAHLLAAAYSHAVPPTELADVVRRGAAAAAAD
jgi:hypothetical protein